jgi:hypothetical protein
MNELVLVCGSTPYVSIVKLVSIPFFLTSPLNPLYLPFHLLISRVYRSPSSSARPHDRPPCPSTTALPVVIVMRSDGMTVIAKETGRATVLVPPTTTGKDRYRDYHHRSPNPRDFDHDRECEPRASSQDAFTWQGGLSPRCPGCEGLW